MTKILKMQTEVIFLVTQIKDNGVDGITQQSFSVAIFTASVIVGNHWFCTKVSVLQYSEAKTIYCCLENGLSNSITVYLRLSLEAGLIYTQTHTQY